MTKQEKAREVLRRLKQEYKKPGPFVEWKTPLELVVGTVLSAQCTDARVNMVTRTLFKKYRTASQYAHANIRALEKEIYSTGFYKSKARYLKGIGLLLKNEFAGKIPRKKEDLLRLPGVSHKSANLIMSKLYNEHVGVAVDTHVKRVAPRLGLTKRHSPEHIAADLEQLLDPKDFLSMNEYLITHGRAICKPQNPLCGSCVLADICPSAKKFLRH